MESWLIKIIAIILLFAIIYFILKKVGFAGTSETGKEAYEADAKRFARLLITEIKLYEDYKIKSGLQNNNLYESLHDEIEEARKKYKKRVQNAEFDRHFENALVEILADGDRSKLGLNSASLNK